jgi:hypothetical protein
MKLASRFGVSDVAIAKACRKHKIPLPGRGYWNRVQAGQKMMKAPLPNGEEETITFSRDTREVPQAITSSLQVPVPATTRNLHPIAAQTYPELRQQVQSKERRFGNDWGRTWARPGLLNIRVTGVSWTGQ